MKVMSTVYFLKEDFDVREMNRLMDLNYFNLSDFALEEVRTRHYPSMEFTAFDFEIDFEYDERFQKMMETTFPFMTSYYYSVSEDYDIGEPTHNLVLGSLNKTMCSIDKAVTIERKPLIIGEYSQKFNESEVDYISSGIFHEVVVLKNGLLITRGSNANNQLDFTNNYIKIDDLQCGDSFTAILSEGKVFIAGKLHSGLHRWPEEVSLKLSSDFKLLPEDVSHDIFQGDNLTLKVGTRKVEVYHKKRLLGVITNRMKQRKHVINHILEYNAVNIKKIGSDYIDMIVERTKQEIIIGFKDTKDFLLEEYKVKQISTNEWPTISKIFVLEHGILGKSKSNEFYFDGTVNNIVKLKNLLDREVSNNVSI